MAKRKTHTSSRAEVLQTDAATVLHLLGLDLRTGAVHPLGAGEDVACRC